MMEWKNVMDRVNTLSSGGPAGSGPAPASPETGYADELNAGPVDREFMLSEWQQLDELVAWLSPAGSGTDGAGAPAGMVHSRAGNAGLADRKFLLSGWIDREEQRVRPAMPGKPGEDVALAPVNFRLHEKNAVWRGGELTESEWRHTMGLVNSFAKVRFELGDPARVHPFCHLLPGIQQTGFVTEESASPDWHQARDLVNSLSGIPGRAAGLLTRHADVKSPFGAGRPNASQPVEWNG